MSDKTVQPGPPRRRRSRLGATLQALVRTRVTAGLLVVLPVWITVLLIKFIFGMMRDSSLWVIEVYLRSPLGAPLLERWKVPAPLGYIWPEGWPPAGSHVITITQKLHHVEERLGRTATLEEFFNILPIQWQWGASVVAVLLTIFILYVVGLFAANMVGRRAIGLMELLLDKVPLVKSVYRASKQVLETFTSEQKQNFQRVALFPFLGVHSVGFVTNSFKDPETGEDYVTVFYPTTPNPTTGYFLIMKRSLVRELDWTMEEAARVVMSGGILMPHSLAMSTAAPVPGSGSPPAPGAQTGAATNAS